MSEALFLISLATCLYMTGLIWFVQRVHYPLMAEVKREDYREYQAKHERRTLPVVVLCMTLELASGLALIVWRPDWMALWTALVSAGLVGITWLSTAFLQVPCHGKLAELGFDQRIHARLVSSNWIRTIAWSARSALLLWVIAGVIQG